MRTFKVSGTALCALLESDVRLDPAVGAPLRDATPRRMGGGVSWRMTATEEGAETLREWCAQSGHEIVQTEADEGLRRVGKALLVVAANIEAAPVEHERQEGECSNGCGAPAGGASSPNYPDVCEQWPLCTPL
jgi:hypothetical protein